MNNIFYLHTILWVLHLIQNVVRIGRATGIGSVRRKAPAAATRGIKFNLHSLHTTTKINTAPHDLRLPSTKNVIRSDVDIAIYLQFAIFSSSDLLGSKGAHEFKSELVLPLQRVAIDQLGRMN